MAGPTSSETVAHVPDPGSGYLHLPGESIKAGTELTFDYQLDLTQQLGYPSYPSALINPNPLGFPYPTPTGYFGGGDPNIQNLESSNIGMHHQLPSAPPPPSNSSSAGHTPSATVFPPTLSSFPTMFSPAAAQQNAFLATWKYCQSRPLLFIDHIMPSFLSLFKRINIDTRQSFFFL